MTAKKAQVHLNSGRRTGPPEDSLHNQGLAVDVAIEGLTSPEVAAELRALGFTCAITYYKKRGQPCHMAHGDLRNTTLAQGPYSPGGHKAATCPAMALSRTGSCDNDTKGQWRYVGSQKSGP
jgi:hypothetical protein